jgi:hypothetical protein
MKLKYILLIDAVITVGFGLYSWFDPINTFGTIISISDVENSPELAILSTVSILYVLIGLVAIIGAKAKYPTLQWIALLMILRHLWLGIMKFLDIGKEWLIGDPYPDIIIHSLFVLFYLLGIYLTIKYRLTTK